MSEGEWLRGKLLLSLPTVREDAFYRTVILLLQHSPNKGALGVVLNRPTPIGLAEIFPEMQYHAAEPAVLFEGGPVEPDGIICLAHGGNEQLGGFAPVLDEWGSIDPRESPPIGVDNVRVYRGYAGWAPRQLEGELARDAWLVTEPFGDEITAAEPEDLWDTIVDRQGPQLANIKRVPRDPSLN